MHRTLGATCVTCLLAITGFSALGAAGFMTMSGKSVCGLVQGCDKAKETTATEKTVKTVANKEGEASGCCAMKALAAKAAAAKSGCCKSASRGIVTIAASHPIVMPAMFYKADANFCTAGFKEAGGCDSPCTGAAGAKVVNAAAADKASGCCKGSGVRADGEACKKDGAQCEKEKSEKAAEKPADAEKKAEPVASRN